MIRLFFRNFLVAVVTASLVAPLHLVAVEAKSELAQDVELESDEELFLPAIRKGIEDSRKDPQVRQAAAVLEEISSELEQADENTYPRDIPDPFHLTRQFLLMMRKGGNVGDRYHLAGPDGGLPRVVVQPSAVQAVNFDDYLAFHYKRGVHVIESIKPALMVYDKELLAVVDTDGVFYAIDLSFARKELFKAPVPVHKIPYVSKVSKEMLPDLQFSFVTRGLSPFSYELTADGELKRINFTRHFVAGDLVMWQERDGKRVLVDVIGRDHIVNEINNGNFLLGRLAQVLRGNKDLAKRQGLDQILDREEKGGRSLDPKKFKHYQENFSAKAEQVLQSIDAERLQKMIMSDIIMSKYRDDFTYARWQRDYLLIRNQARITIDNLQESVNKKYKIIKDLTAQNQLDSLKKQLREGDFGESWILLSKLYIDETKDFVIDKIHTLKELKTPEAAAKAAELKKILHEHDYERLWNEPQLISGIDKESPLRTQVKRFFYKHLSGDDLRNLASTALGITTLSAAGVGAAWALKTGFSLKGLYPDSLKLKHLPRRPELADDLINKPYNAVRINYRRHMLKGIGTGLLLIPIVAWVAHLSARATGQEWDFRKQLTLFGMRVYATVALPFWHYLSRLAGQDTLMPAMAARVSPFEVVDGKSSTGADIGLDPDEKVRVGLRNPFSRMSDNEEAVRRRAISMLQQQRVRAQGLGWEIARDIVLVEYLWGKKISDVDAESIISRIEDTSFKKRWQRLAKGLEKEIYRLYTDGVYADLRTVPRSKVHEFLYKTKPQVLRSSYYESVERRLRYGIGDLVSSAGKHFATLAVNDVNFLQMADPDDFVSSMIWNSFMIDFFTVVGWEGLKGARANVFHPQVTGANDQGIGHLMATNKFPYWQKEHAEMLVGQVYVYSISAQGRYSLVFQMLQKLEEDRYRPLQELLVMGQDRSQGFWEGLVDFGKNSADLRNVNYGEKYKRQFLFFLTMAQGGLLANFVLKGLVAGVRPSRIPIQYIYQMFWATWGFAWPWVALYSTGQLQEIKNKTRNGIFMQAKVKLKKAIEQNDTEGIHEGYADFISVYREFGVQVPSSFVEAVREVENNLGLSEEDRLSADVLLPYIGLLVQLQEADSMTTKRAVYRRLVGFIDDGEQNYVINEEEADRFLHFMLVNPPFPTRLSPVIGFLGVFAAAISTTWLGSIFHRRTFGNPTKNLGAVTPYIAMGMAINLVVWTLLDKRNARKIWDFSREKILGYPQEQNKEEY